jgi:hypothetical protein
MRVQRVTALLVACFLFAAVRGQDGQVPGDVDAGASAAAEPAADPGSAPAGGQEAAPPPLPALSSQPGAGSSSSLLSSLSQSQGIPPLGALPDPLNLGVSPPGMSQDPTRANTLPPFQILNSQSTISPHLVTDAHATLSLDLDRRIKQTEDLLNRMIWQLNRETSWANSVHDIIQNYQYKYTKVLSGIKKHTERTTQMRTLLTQLKKARLHEILESDLSRATRELTELASSSAETSADEGSYASLKDRVALMKADLEKMSHAKVHKVLHNVQDSLKKQGEAAVPPPSADTLVSLMDGAKK